MSGGSGGGIIIIRLADEPTLPLETRAELRSIAKKFNGTGQIGFMESLKVCQALWRVLRA